MNKILNLFAINNTTHTILRLKKEAFDEGKAVDFRGVEWTRTEVKKLEATIVNLCSPAAREGKWNKRNQPNEFLGLKPNDIIFERDPKDPDPTMNKVVEFVKDVSQIIYQ